MSASIVDFLRSQNQDSSFGARQGLAQQHGINNYTGSAQQNTQLLGAVQNQQAPTQSNYSTNSVDIDKYRTESATIDDIASKYGFDFSRDNASRQAEAEAQAKRNASQQGMKAVDNRVEGSVDALDRNYFQKYMQQAQNQTNSGLNAGIAADQDLRLAMNRQASMGDIYRDANLAHQQLQDQLGQVDLERLVREDSLYNQRRMQGAELAQNQDQFNLSQNQAMLNAAWDQHQFNNMSAYQQAALAEQAAGRRQSAQSSGWEQQYNELLEQLLQQQYDSSVQGRQNSANFQTNKRNRPDHQSTNLDPWIPQY